MIIPEFLCTPSPWLSDDYPACHPEVDPSIFQHRQSRRGIVSQDIYQNSCLDSGRPECLHGLRTKSVPAATFGLGNDDKLRDKIHTTTIHHKHASWEEMQVKTLASIPGRQWTPCPGAAFLTFRACPWKAWPGIFFVQMVSRWCWKPQSATHNNDSQRIWLEHILTADHLDPVDAARAPRTGVEKNRPRAFTNQSQARQSSIPFSIHRVLGFNQQLLKPLPKLKVKKHIYYIGPL